MVTFLRTNPAVAGMLLLVVIASVVLGALSIWMTRLGLSLRPVVFMAVLFGIVAGPQAAFHLAQALGAIPKRDLAWTFGSSRPHAGWVEREAALRAEDGRFVDPVAVFGPAAGGVRDRRSLCIAGVGRRRRIAIPRRRRRDRTRHRR